jgi:hypothetical protein
MGDAVPARSGHNGGVIDLLTPYAGVLDEFQEQGRHFSIIRRDLELIFEGVHWRDQKSNGGQRSQEARVGW